MKPLPIDAAMPDIIAALRPGRQCLVEAEPGAGKSTRIAPAATQLGTTWLLQPRRVAAIGVAHRIADEQGWQLGQEVGYAVRHDRRGQSQTRCWVATDGVLLRQLYHDPLLEHIDCLLFDEFHERSVASEILLSWACYVQQELRPELRIGILSATLPGAELQQLLPAAELLSVPGRTYPVDVMHRPAPLAVLRGPKRELEQFWVSVIEQAVAQLEHDNESGDVLVFLPGVGEINRVQAAFERQTSHQVEVLTLHGSLPIDQQVEVLRPEPTRSRRRIILATNIAETSLTVPGVRVVIDSTQQRHATVDPQTGLERLDLIPVAQSSLTQRMGRAGREAPGRCYRCCSKQDEARRPAFLLPELQTTDLSQWLPLMMQIHGKDVASFPWLQPPSIGRVRQAQALLQLLGWLDADHGLSGKARLLAAMPCHPRLASLCLYAASQGALGLGCELAAMLSEKDLYRRERPASLPGGHDDVAERWQVWHEAQRRGQQWCRQYGVDIQAVQAIERTAQQLRRVMAELGDVHATSQDPEGLIPRCVLAAYPDRVAIRKDDRSNQVHLCAGVAGDLDPCTSTSMKTV